MPRWIATNYAQELKQIRVSLGLSQKAFGELLGLPPTKIGTNQTISRYEIGTHHVPEPVMRLARLLLANARREGGVPEPPR